MNLNPSTYALQLTAAEGDHLLRLVAIGQLALAEHQRSGWLPTRALDATQMSEHVRALSTAIGRSDQLGGSSPRARLTSSCRLRRSSASLAACSSSTVAAC